MELNERLAKLRKEHGLSQNDLADQLKVSRQAVSRWEQGLAMPSSDNLIYLSKLYGITLDELIHGKKEGGAEKKQNNRRSPPFFGTDLYVCRNRYTYYNWCHKCYICMAKIRYSLC